MRRGLGVGGFEERRMLATRIYLLFVIDSGDLDPPVARTNIRTPKGRITFGLPKKVAEIAPCAVRRRLSPSSRHDHLDQAQS